MNPSLPFSEESQEKKKKKNHYNADWHLDYRKSFKFGLWST